MARAGTLVAFVQRSKSAALVVVRREVLDHRVGAAGLNSFNLFSADHPDEVRVLAHVFLGLAPCMDGGSG